MNSKNEEQIFYDDIQESSSLDEFKIDKENNKTISPKKDFNKRQNVLFEAVPEVSDSNNDSSNFDESSDYSSSESDYCQQQKTQNNILSGLNEEILSPSKNQTINNICEDLQKSPQDQQDRKLANLAILNFSEIRMFSKEFVIEYNHYEAKQLKNEHQIKMTALCEDMGVQMVSSDQKEVVDIIYKMLSEEEKTQSHRSQLKNQQHNLMKIDVLFGNQNIKETMISRLESTENFIDQELTFRFRPITLIYRQEFASFFKKFISIKEGINDEVKLRALERYERLRQNITLEKVFENQNQIRSNTKLHIELDSSKIIVPIQESGLSMQSECWLFNTGHILLTNSKQQLNELSSNQKEINETFKDWKCDPGYKPLHISVIQLNMAYCSNINDLAGHLAESNKQNVLKDLNIRIMAMLRENDQIKQIQQVSKATTLREPLMKLKIAAEELRLIFNPITYVHIVNIGKCFQGQQQDFQTKQAQREKLKERLDIIFKAKAIDLVRKKANTSGQYWIDSIAIFSGKYIYFFNLQNAQSLKELSLYLKRIESRIKLKQEMIIRNSTDYLPQPISQEEEDSENFEYNKKAYQDDQALEILNLALRRLKNDINLTQALNNLVYDEYFLVKGCTNIQSIEEYKKQIEVRKNVLLGKSSIKNRLSLFKKDQEFNSRLSVGNESNPNENKLEVGTQLRLKNSMNTECIIQFKELAIQEKWRDLISQTAAEIDQVLGKNQYLLGYSLKDNNIVEDNNLELKDVIESEEQQNKKISEFIGVGQIGLQVLSHYNVKFGKFELIVQSTSKIYLNSKLVDGKTKDQIILSTQQPTQFNKPESNIFHKDLGAKWSYSLVASNFIFIQSSRQFDSDKIITIEALSIEERDPNFISNRISNTRYPMLMRTMIQDEKKKQIKNVLRILIKSQQIESPRYNNILMENEINLGKIHFDWNPVSINRFVRFFRFYKYTEDVVEYEKLKLKQSFKIQLENLHKKQEDSFQKEIKIEKPKLKKQQTIEPSINQDFNNSNRNRQSLRHTKQNSIQNTFLISDETPSRTTCAQDPTVFVQVSLSIEKIYVVCIHPQNDSFPIFTKKFDKLQLNYQSLMDHDTIEGKIGNFRIMDNTNYPQTLDPFKDYKQNDKVPQTQILGFRSLSNSPEMSALTFDITMFHYPLDHCCPIQEKNNNSDNNTFDKLVKIKIEQLHILHMQELNFRLNDYFFYQIIYALTDANPYLDDILRRLKQEMDPFFYKKKPKKKKEKKQKQVIKKEQIIISDAYIYYEDSSISNVAESLISNSFSNSLDTDNYDILSSDEESFEKSDDKFDFLFNNQNFDLKQYPLTTGLDIKIENPLIVLKDRPYFDQDIQIDLGQIHISSSLQEIPGKWKQFPHKLTFVNTIQIFMSQVRIDYNKKSAMIAPPFDMNIDFTRINYSELLQEQFLSKGIDFEQFDKSDNLTIVSSAFQLNFDQPMYTYLLRCLDLNINFYDQMAHGFQLFTWNSQDYMKYLDLERDIVAKFRNRPVTKRIVQLKFPSLSIKIKDQKREPNKNYILSELVLQNLQIDLFQYLDYRKHIKLNSQTIYILCKDLENLKNIKQETNKNDKNTKTLIIGPMKSSRIIQTQNNFYQGFTSYTPEKIKMPQICLIRDSLSSPEKNKIKNEMIFDNEDIKLKEWKPLDLSTASFCVDIKMEADGARVTEIKLKELKLFLKIDALQVLSQFFSQNFPKYDKTSLDKPTYFEEDYGNYAKQEMLVDLNDCLICFEQTDDLIELNKDPSIKQSLSEFSSPSQSQKKSRKYQDKEQQKNNMELFGKTIAFQGQLQYNFVREKANQLKKDLLNDLEADDYLIKRSEGFQKRLKTTQVHIIDFQPFFCDKSDLYEGGIPLKMIKKRQMISPSNLFFNQNDIIEIKEKQIKQTKRKYQKQLKQIIDVQKISGSGGIEIDYTKKSKVLDKTKEEELKEKEMKELMNDNNYIQYKKCELNLDLAEIQISFNELISLKGIQKKLSEMNNNFENYCENIKVDEEIEIDESNIKLPQSNQPNFLQKKNKNQSESEEEEQNTQKGIDQFQLVSHGLKLILINDRENNFLPVLSLNFGHFTIQWDCNPNQSCLWTDLNMSSNFFNVNVGVWEPFIEPFNFKLILKEETIAKIRNISLTFYTPLNINLTEKLVENLYESNQSWGLVNQRFDDFHYKFKQMLIEPDNYLQQSFVYTSDKKHSSQLLLQKGQLKLDKRDVTEDWFKNEKIKSEMKEETITPYVIVNKTDIAIFIKSLDDIPQENQYQNSFLNQLQENSSHYQAKTNFGPKPFKNNQILNLFDPGFSNINQSFTDMQYRLEPGQIIDYMVDYSKSIKKQDQSQECDFQEQISQTGISLTIDNENFFYPYSPPIPQRNATQISADLKENIHLDSIGEYKSEFVRVLFDSQSSEVNEGRINFAENRALDRVDLNEIGMNHHVLRGGNFKETLFYSIKIIDFKKVFTLRTQYQLVNRTTVDYLVHFKFVDQSIVKFLESGDSLPLSMQYDSSQIQIKMITNKNQNKLQEEIIAQNQLINDFKDAKWGPQINNNWSSLIPIQILKYRLPFYEGSYLKNGTSLFTYIRKVKADQIFSIIDINFMTPLIVKNCLPFELQLAFKDSSNVIQSHSFQKNEEKYFYCFSLANSVSVDILVPGFKPKRGFKIVSLKKQNLPESQIEIEDELGLRTLIYSQLSRTQAGFRVVLYAKKLLIDQLNSKLQYFYALPRIESLQQEYFNSQEQRNPEFIWDQLSEKELNKQKTQISQRSKQNQNNQENNIYIDQMRIPFVLQIELKQRIFIIPEDFSNIFVAVTYQVDLEIQKIDIETPTGQAIFRVQTKNKTLDYCVSTNVYLATQNENIYSKISTVNPLYIFVNESNYSIKIEQAETKFHKKHLFSLAINEAKKSQSLFESLGLSGRDKQQIKIEEIQSKLQVPLPLVLAPKQRHAFFFENIHTQIPGIEELIHISLVDEHVTAQELQELVQEKNVLDFNDSESIYKHRVSHSSQSIDTMSQISKSSNSNIKFSGQKSTIDPLKGHLQSQQYIFRPSTFGANRSIQTQQSQIITRDEVVFKKQYNWSSPFMISEVDTFTLRVNPMTSTKQKLLEQMNCLTIQERLLLTKILTQEKYLKVKIKADCKQAPGSMFILVDEEESDTQMYQIDNQSKYFDLIFFQNIGTHPFWNQRLNMQSNYQDQNKKIQESYNSYRCKSGKKQRFTWESILHQKVIRISFTNKQIKMNNKILENNKKLEFINYNESQQMRMLPCQSEGQREDQNREDIISNQQRNRLTDLLIPFDKIGHGEKIQLVLQMSDYNQPSAIAQVTISIVTNGFTKTLQIQDYKAETDQEIILEQQKQNKQFDSQTQMVELSFSKIMLSFIHKRSELMTIFISKLNSVFTETVQHKSLRFTVGYLQIDNQTEKNPVYPILLKPKDLYYDKVQDTIQMHVGEEQTVNDASLFQFQMVINNKQSVATHKRHVMYIESIMFLLQTLQIKVQFDHFLKIINYGQHIGKILNKSVNVVHFLFDLNIKNKRENQYYELKEQNDQESIVENKKNKLKRFSRIHNDLYLDPLSDPEYIQKIYNNIEIPILKVSQSLNNNQVVFSKKKIETVIMPLHENNWQFGGDLGSANEWRLFIKEYQSSPTELFVSCMNTRQGSKKQEKQKARATPDDDQTAQSRQETIEEDEEDIQMQEEGAIQILGALGEVFVRKILYFSTFEDMQFQMKGITVSSLLGEGNEVITYLVKYHKEQFKFNVFKLIGASDLIGNPTRFINNIGVGVTDFFVKPYQGVKDGSIVKFRDGLIDGSKSLLQKTFMAPVGAIATVGQSLSKGAILLSFDDQFIDQKKLIESQNKPRSLQAGFKQGIASAQTSIKSGLVGFYNKPREGFDKEGVIGLVKGQVQGALGLVFKTISGGIDIVAKTSEGQYNELRGEVGLLSLVQRIREPRTFYGEHSIIRVYPIAQDQMRMMDLIMTGLEQDIHGFYDIDEESYNA